MTRPHPTTAELLAHARRIAPPAETLEVSGHLVNCAHCREVFASLSTAPASRTDEALTGSTQGVDYETLTGYLDNTLDPVDREILEADLRNHSGLAAQLADLRRLRAEEEPTATPEVTNVVPFPAARRPLRWVAAAAAMLLVAGLCWRYAFASRTDLALRDDGREASFRTLLEMADLPPDLQGVMHTTALTGQLPRPADWQALRGKVATLLADPAKPATGKPAFGLLEPVGEMVRGMTPTLRWTPYDGASAYRVTLLEAPDGEARSSPILPAAGGNAWIPAPPLVAGKRYSWQVQALDLAGNVLSKTPSPPQPDALFQTMDTTQEADLHRLELAHPQAHLLLAVATARLGLLAEAEQHLQALAKANPGKPLPADLLRQVESLRGDGHSSAAGTPTATNGAQ